MIQKIIPLLLLPVVLSGCATRKHPVTIDKNNLASISYNANHCRELIDKRVVCNDVVFTPKSVSVGDLRQGK